MSLAAAPAVRVLVADDQTFARTGIVMLLATEPGIEIVAEVTDGAEAISAARRYQPDVVVMDVRMPVVDGVEATRQITADGFSPPDRTIRVLALTAYHVHDAVYGALRAGASGFLLKDTAPAQLVPAIHRLAAGEAWLDPGVAGGLIKEFAARPDYRAPSPAEVARLTARERDVLVLVAYGMSNSEIAAHLYIGEATVKTHLGRLTMKLGLRDRAQAVVVAYQTGLVRPGTCPPPVGSAG